MNEAFCEAREIVFKGVFVFFVVVFFYQVLSSGAELLVLHVQKRQFRFKIMLIWSHQGAGLTVCSNSRH